MALFNRLDRKKRPGVYLCTVNRDAQKNKPTVEAEQPQKNAVLVSPDGVMYARGSVFSVVEGSDGEMILVFEENTGVTSFVSGETLDIRNPGS